MGNPCWRLNLRLHRFYICLVVLVVCDALLGCATDQHRYDAAMDPVNLGIPDRQWDAKRPDPSVGVWIQDNLWCGRPVIYGCKLYPDEHPDWNLDHFVLVVGCNAEGLLLNTQLDMGGQLLVPYGRLASNRSRNSFKNRRERFFGRAITGLRR